MASMVPTNSQVDTIQDPKRLPRRRHDAALKRQVLAECGKPEASLAGTHWPMA